ncbi:MAG: DNA-3-methyladenine glycosylase I [Actinomycetia bacterium]|nr:DNA-3-methyladenine glycosylase I [Actinomycetes bacterium]
MTQHIDSPIVPSEGGSVERCFSRHVATDPVYVRYHDEEWGRPVRDETALFERICLEGFQVGLSWRTVLHKRDAFRDAFRGFDPERVARFGEADLARLASDPGIIRNRAKIAASIRAAQIVCDLAEQGSSLSDLIWAHRPAIHARPKPGERASTSPESEALAKALHRLGFRFVGPVNVYATMQACGLVNDHVAGCAVGDDIEAATREDSSTAPG